MLPTVNFLGTPLTRLMYGDNPFNGHSYVEQVHPGSEMVDYYTADRCVEALFEAEKGGINAYMALGEPFVLRVIRQYRQEGGKMHVLFQSYPAMDLDANLNMMMQYEPLGIYHQGGTADYYVESGQTELLRARLCKIKERGVPVGLGTHVPETLLMAESEDWGCDFYMACLYNARREQRGQQSGFITGKPKELVFYPEDRFLMMEAIRQVSKPVIAFKILAGGQRLMNKPEDEVEREIELAFREAYQGIKPGDLALVGTFQKNKNEIAQDCAIVKRVLGAL